MGEQGSQNGTFVPNSETAVGQVDLDRNKMYDAAVTSLDPAGVCHYEREKDYSKGEASSASAKYEKGEDVFLNSSGVPDVFTINNLLNKI